MGNYEPVHGGFGRAPKFPHPTDLSFLMKEYYAGKNKNILEAAF